MEPDLRAFFERYESTFNRALAGDSDMEEVAALYAAEFIAATPSGVTSGKNDTELERAMAEGYARYRAIGTKGMRVRNVRVLPLDDLHCVASVAWTATYARKDRPDVAIDFEVHYFVRALDGESKVFGWVSGDEDALLREYGIV